MELKFRKLTDAEGNEINSQSIAEVAKQFDEMDIGLPKAKFKLTDDEFLELLKAIDSRRIPVSMLDEIFPYKIKRDRDGRFIGLPGGLDERAKGLGIRLSRLTYESPETDELFVEINCNKMTQEEIDEFLTKRNARLERYISKGDGDFKRVMCSICNTRVQFGVHMGEYKIYCGCDETPFEAIDVSNLLDVERLRNWK